MQVGAWRGSLPSLVSKFEAKIDKYIESHPEADLRRREPFELDGKRHELEVYSLPSELLRFNIRNGRFAAELREREAELNRQLNPEIPDDSKEIEKLLLRNSTQADY